MSAEDFTWVPPSVDTQNMIAGGRFVLHGKEYQGTRNKNCKLLHGGEVGFDKKYWPANVHDGREDPAVEMKPVSPDGYEGFLETLEIGTVFRVTADNELRIEYDAVLDRLTAIDITNHSYFNLTGSAANLIKGNLSMIGADAFTPDDTYSISTGSISDVAGRPLDFRKPAPIGDRIDESYIKLQNRRGY